MLGRGDSLFTRKLCFHSVEAALFPDTLVSEGFLDDREGLGVIWGGFINWGVLGEGLLVLIEQVGGCCALSF